MRLEIATASDQALIDAGRRGRLPQSEQGDLGPRPGLAWMTSLIGRGQKIGSPLFWLAIVVGILAPCACFLVLAISPRLFDQGTQWFTLSYLEHVFTGSVAASLINSLWVSIAAATLGIAIGFPMAWFIHRTNIMFRRFFGGAMWLVLLLPSWIPAIGWERLVQPDGVAYRLGIGASWETNLIMGPFGVVLLLGLRSVPFSYLAISAALGGLGQEFEDAARVHGASRLGAIKLVAPILAPAIWSGIAIGFAESVSDFGVAATLAYSSHFTLATYQLYQSIGNFPPSFPGAAAMAWLLVAMVAIPLWFQARSLRGRSYAVLSGRTRQVVRRSLGRKTRIGAVSLCSGFYLLAIGVPAFGAVSASMLADFGASLKVSFANYRAVFTSSGLAGPLVRSLIYGLITASITVVAGFIAARMLSKTRTRSAVILDTLLLASVALPGIVFAAGYIFAFNLPVLSKIGINIYQTTTRLVVGYIATSLPTNARVLVGAVSQVQPSLHDAARVHGSGPAQAWARGVLPAVSRPIVMAWLLTFTGIFLELPVSELLYAPGSPPASIAIQDNLGNYHFGVGMAQAVIASLVALLIVGIVLGAYRVLAPRGWRRIGGGTRG